MKEYVEVPDILLKKTKELQKYLQISYEYAENLKPMIIITGDFPQ